MSQLIFPHSVSFYLPSKQHLRADLPEDRFLEIRTRIVRETIEDLAVVFGGATSYAAHGAYVSDAGTLIAEDITVVLAFGTDEVYNAALAEDLPLRIAARLCRALFQESFLYTCDGTAFLYFPE